MEILPAETVGIALGSNLGNRAQNLERGFAFLATLAEDGQVRRSDTIETMPVNCPPGTEVFYNAVAEIHTRLSAFELVRRFKAFEQELGRPADATPDAPRALDLDLLYYGDLILHTEELTLPHPRLKERLFVLQPLAQIRPDLILPMETKTVLELLQRARQSLSPAPTSS